MVKLIRIFLVAALAIVCVAAGEEGYVIRMSRPDKAGMKFEVSIASAMRQEVMEKDADETKTLSESVVAVTFEGMAEIMEVDEKGNDLQIKYTVKKCAKSAGEKEETVLKEGQVFVASLKGDKTIYALTGGKLSPEQEDALGYVAYLSPSDAANTDDIYGTNQKQKVGAEWGINPAVSAKDFKRHNYLINPEDIKGTVKLVGIEKTAGVDCLSIKAEMKIEKGLMEPPKEWALPKGMVVSNVSIENGFTGLIPIDLELGHVFSVGTHNRTLTLTGTGRRSDVKREIKTARIYEIRAIPVK